MNQSTVSGILARVLQEMMAQNGGDLGELIPVRVGQRIYDENSVQAFRAGDFTYVKRRDDNKDFVHAWSSRLGRMTDIRVKTFRVLKITYT